MCVFHIYVNRETIKGGPACHFKDLSATRVLRYTQISISIPLSFMISICKCMCQERNHMIHKVCRIAFNMIHKVFRLAFNPS